MAEENDKKRSRTCSLEDEEVDSPVVKKLRQDLLDNLEDDEVCSTSEDLDSFMKSFKEQISSTHAPPHISSFHAQTEPPKLNQAELNLIPLDGIDNMLLPKLNQIEPSLIDDVDNVSLPNKIEASLIPLRNVSLSKPNQIELSFIQLDGIKNGNMSLLDLGYLLEASDDELGLPPPSMASPPQLADEEVEELVPITGFDSFEVDFIDFDSFEFGLDLIENSSNGVGNEYLALDGLFDYSDMGLGSADFVC